MKTLLLILSLLLIPSAAFGAEQNYLINGGFDFWQRGTANASQDSAGYLADRWHATAGTYDQNAANLPTGQKYGAQLAFSASSGWLCQRIESNNTRLLSGKKMTISGWERSSAGTGPLKFKIDRPNTVDDYVGKGKLGTTLTNELAATTLLSSTSTTLTKFRYTFPVSANMASYGFQVCLGTDASTTTTYQISAVMLNEGLKVEPFRISFGGYGLEENLAFRYHERGNNGSFSGDSITYSRAPFVSFKQNKRSASGYDASCTATWYQTGGGSGSGCNIAEKRIGGIAIGGPANNSWSFSAVAWIIDDEL